MVEETRRKFFERDRAQLAKRMVSPEWNSLHMRIKYHVDTSCANCTAQPQPPCSVACGLRG